MKKEERKREEEQRWSVVARLERKAREELASTGAEG